MDIVECKGKKVAASIGLKLHQPREGEIGGGTAELGGNTLVEVAGGLRKGFGLVRAERRHSGDSKGQNDANAEKNVTIVLSWRKRATHAAHNPKINQAVNLRVK